MIDYDDEDDCLLTPVFRVGDCSNIDTSKPPSSGAEYLQRVHLESKKCPQIVVAKLDMRKLNSKQTVRYSDETGFTPAPRGLAPNPKVTKEQVSSFSSLRFELALKQKRILDQLPPVVFPDVSDRMGWCDYCLGTEVKKKVEQISKRNATNMSATRRNKSETEVSPRKFQDEVHEGHDPLLSVMLHLPHSTIEKLLAYHLNWLQLIGFSSKQGQWIFSLLALLQKPLRPETCDLLRRVARVCASLRADLKSALDENLIGLNHIICLVSCYFDQKDMSDNFAEKAVGQLLGHNRMVNEDISDDDDQELSESEEDDENNNGISN